MKKILIILLLIAFVTLPFFISGCYKKDYSDYKNEEGYAEYISDSTAGYNDVPYYFVNDSMNVSKEARIYFDKNSRRCGDFLITNYENGVCINKYYGKYPFYGDIIIPNEIAGKPVVKLGGYIEEKHFKDMSESITSAFGGHREVTLKIPSTVKVISREALQGFSGMISEEDENSVVSISKFVVDEDNPYYSSKNGSLYSKDYKKLLWVYTDAIYIADNPEWTKAGYIIPDFVEIFEPSNGIADSCSSVTFGKNVKEINTFIDKGENGCEPDPEVMPDVTIRGYKGSAAEKWAKEQYVAFVPLD